MKEVLKRLAYKTTGFKALFTVAVLTLLFTVDLTDTNAGVLKMLIPLVLGARVAQYAIDKFGPKGE